MMGNGRAKGLSIVERRCTMYRKQLTGRGQDIETVRKQKITSTGIVTQSSIARWCNDRYG